MPVNPISFIQMFSIESIDISNSAPSVSSQVRGLHLHFSVIRFASLGSAALEQRL